MMRRRPIRPPLSPVAMGMRGLKWLTLAIIWVLIFTIVYLTAWRVYSTYCTPIPFLNTTVCKFPNEWAIQWRSEKLNVPSLD